jgi:hypothetical protein
MSPKGYPPENAETPGRGLVGVADGLFHFLEKAAEPLKTHLKGSKKFDCFLPRFW